jgi:hypothetical protein
VRLWGKRDDRRIRRPLYLGEQGVENGWVPIFFVTFIVLVGAWENYWSNGTGQTQSCWSNEKT